MWIKNNPWKTAGIAIVLIYAIGALITKQWNPMKWFSGMSVERPRSRECATCCTTQNVSCPNCDCSHYRVAGSPVLDARGNIK